MQSVDEEAKREAEQDSDDDSVSDVSDSEDSDSDGDDLGSEKKSYLWDDHVKEVCKLCICALFRRRVRESACAHESVA